MDTVTRTKVMFSIGALLSLLLVIPSTQAAWQPDPAFGLGDAGQFAVLSLGKPSAETLGQSKLDLSAVEIYGDVGVGPYGVLDFQGPSTIHGDLYIDRTLLAQDILSDVGTVNGSRFYDADLSGPVGDAIAASDSLSFLTPTQTLGRLLSSTTVYGNGEMNVIAIDGIDYARSNPNAPLVLTLMGGENDLFVLNVKGKFVLGPNAQIRSPDPSQLLINVLEGKVPVQFASDSLIEGTLLATSRKMGPLQGTSGPVIGALVSEISLLGGATVMRDTPMVSAVITAPSEVMVGMPATLDGSASSTPFGDPLNYQWWLLEKPIGSLTGISEEFSPTTYMIPDMPGDYLVQLVVDDGEGSSDTAQTSILAYEPREGVDLVLVITDDPDPVVRKQTLRYTMALQNQGTEIASDVVLSGVYTGDVRGSAIISPEDSCAFSSLTEFNCMLGDLESMESAKVELTVVPKAYGEFEVTATSASTEPDLDTLNNTATESTTVLK